MVVGQTQRSLAVWADLLSLQAEKANYDNLKKLSAQALVEHKGAKGQDSTLAKIHYFAASAALHFQELDQAEQHFKQALDLIHPDSVAYALTLVGLANLYHEQGQAQDIAAMYEQALRIVRKAGKAQTTNYAEILMALGNYYADREEFEDAEPLYLEALDVYRQQVNYQTRQYATCLANLGVLYQEQQRLEAAEQMYREALKIYKLLGLAEHSLASGIHSNLGVLYKNLGRYKEAEQAYQRSLELDRRDLGREHPYYANGLLNLAVLYRGQNRLEEAEAMHLESHAILGKVYDKTHPIFLRSLSSLGGIYLARGRYLDAEAVLIQAATGYKEVFGAKNSNYLRCLQLLAELKRQQKQPEASLTYIQEGLSLCAGVDKLEVAPSKTWVENLSRYDWVFTDASLSLLGNLYELVNEQGDVEASLYCVELGLKLIKKAREDFMAESDKLVLMRRSPYWVERGLKSSLSLGQADKGFEFVEQAKSVLLLEALKQTRTQYFGDLPDSLKQREQSLQQQYRNLQAALLERRPELERDSLRRELNRLHIEIEGFRKKLSQSHPRYAALNRQETPPSTKAYQQQLPKGMAVLQYYLGETQLYLYYLDRDKLHVYPLGLGLDSVNDLVRQMQNNLSNYKRLTEQPEQTYAEYCRLAWQCYQRFLAPALADKTEIEHLLIIPDASLAHLPFETFLSAEVQGQAKPYAELPYLVKRYKLSYNYSLGLWQENRQSRGFNARKGILGFAADYDQSLAKDLNRLPSHRQIRAGLLPLKAAKQEVELLAKHYPGQFYIGSEATEARFKQEAGQYAVLHLAMHGLLNRQNPLLSALAFTEDGDSLENNFLQAYEISQMQLQAELVVLSACETGYGRFERGNGVASLARAFMYAGTPSLIVSLWAVNDASTGLLMSAFYQHLAQGQDKAEALRQAKLSYLQKAEGVYGHPAFWGAFIQLGDERPVQSLQSGRTWPLYLGLAVLLLGALGLGIWWRGRRGQ